MPRSRRRADEPIVPGWRDCKAALDAFVDAIDATGGVVKTRSGHYAPVADEDWIDLGEAYMDACEVLDIEPKVED